MKQSSIRLVAIDVDGTLLDSSHELSDEVRNSVRRLSASGIEVALATGRGPALLHDLIRELDFMPWLICFSGGWIGQVESLRARELKAQLDKRLCRPAVCAVLAFARMHDVEANVFTPENWWVRKMTPEIIEESRIVKLRPAVLPELVTDGKELSKILLITGRDRPSDVLLTIKESIKGFCTAILAKTNYLEIVPPGVNKGRALALLTETLGLNLSDVAAIGDGANDLEMLREAGLSIAMGNASSDLKRIAQWVVRTNDESGVSDAVDRILQGR